jgi:hypothetical protein
LEYRVAYDAARFVLGNGAAFQLFPLLTSMALCTFDPVTAFERLIYAAPRLRPLDDHVANDRYVESWDLLRSEVRDIWIGTAPQVRSVNPDPSHPTCSPAVDQLARSDDIAESRLVATWFANPRASIARFDDIFSFPVMLRSADDGNFPIVFSSGAQNDEEGEAVAGSALGISAMLRRFYEEGSNFEDLVVETPLTRLRWLTRQSHEPLGLEVSVEELGAMDTSHVEGLLTPSESPVVERGSIQLESGEQLADIVSASKEDVVPLDWHELFLGRCMLVYGAPEAAATDRRRFVETLGERVPNAVAYFYFRGDGAGFEEWFGPLDNVHDPEFILSVASTVIDIGTFAKQQGINAWLQARAMLDVFTQEYAELLLEHPLFEPEAAD